LPARRIVNTQRLTIAPVYNAADGRPTCVYSGIVADPDQVNILIAFTKERDSEWTISRRQNSKVASGD
jgi:hypothetical protein